MSLDSAVVYYDPPTACDVCEATIGEEFTDAKTTHGPWANLCPACFRKIGVGLGTGRGQRYRRQPDGQYVKIEG
jgi:hypothetical protein